MSALNNFTEEDFSIINKALEAFPNSDLTGHLMGDLLEMGFGKDKHNDDEYHRKKAEKEEIRQKEREEKIEKIRVVQAKIYFLKQELLKQIEVTKVEHDTTDSTT